MHPTLSLRALLIFKHLDRLFAKKSLSELEGTINARNALHRNKSARTMGRAQHSACWPTAEQISMKSVTLAGSVVAE